MPENRDWKDGRCKDITFIVTKDCQLACKYCYLVGKNGGERMSWDVACRAVDFILSQEHDELFDFEAVVFNFIGGEPFLETSLIDRICDRLKMQMYLRGHHWFDSYRFSITTNGLNYDSAQVQHFINKNRKHLSLTITIDGTRRKHDLNRVWKGDGNRGTYDAVVKNIPLWLSQFPDAATKVTISSSDIPYVCESVMHLFGLGIHTVHINCVFENVWQEGDDLQLEQQMRLLADTMIAQGMVGNYECSLFDKSIGHPLDARNDRNWCGAGLMLAVDASGNLYPCTRFAKYSLREKPPRIIGHIDTGIDKNLVRPYYNLSRSLQSTQECIECEVASGCAWCQGENYDSADMPTIFHRSTAICKMHKARVRANRYFWEKVDKDVDSATQTVDNRCQLDKHLDFPKTIIVLLATDSVPYCIYHVDAHKSELMPLSTLTMFAHQVREKGWQVQFIYPERTLPEEYTHIITSLPNVLPPPSDILRTTLQDFCNMDMGILADTVKAHDRLFIVFTDEADFSPDIEQPYRAALKQLSSMVLKEWRKGRKVQVNLLTDRMCLTSMSNCDAGWQTVTLAPNGRFYVCPAFYYDDENDTCGNLEQGIDIKYPWLYHLDHAPLCVPCKAFHCPRCIYLNRLKTKEVNIPSYGQCLKAELEMEATKDLYTLWKESESA